LFSSIELLRKSNLTRRAGKFITDVPTGSIEELSATKVGANNQAEFGRDGMDTALPPGMKG
jgi:hypothetical protein